MQLTGDATTLLTSFYFQTQTAFHTYSQFAAGADIPLKPSDDERATEIQIQELLEKVHNRDPVDG
jgi:hypothetical protein